MLQLRLIGLRERQLKGKILYDLQERGLLCEGGLTVLQAGLFEQVVVLEEFRVLGEYVSHFRGNVVEKGG